MVSISGMKVYLTIIN